MEIERIRTLVGPNIWAYRPVLEIWLDIGDFEERPSDAIPGFTERLVALLPSLWEHRCSEGRPGGFLERLRLGTYMGHILEHVILELQSLAGMDVGYGRTRGTGRYGQYRVVVDYKDEEAAKLCVNLALEIMAALTADPPEPFDLKPRLDAIREVGEDNMLGPSTQALVDAAKARGIPWFRLNDSNLVQLGHGRYARRIQAAETSHTANIGVEIASDKELTKGLLARVGVPVPEGRVIRSEDVAWETAQRVGLPVVVKPKDGNQGKAVSVNLTTQEQVEAATRLALEYDSRVIIESFYPGNDYRLLVVDGKLVAAALRRPAQVVGNGSDSVQMLVQRVNEDPRRGIGHGAAMTRIRLDDAAALTLVKQGLTWDSVPPAGAVVFLRDNSNLSTGGTATDVTDEVHPDNAAIAELAARTVGLDIAGVDVVTRNIRSSMHENGGGIVEVNAAPGLRMHLYPAEGKSRPVGEAVMAMLFPPERPGRIPLIAITGTNGKTTVTRMITAVYATMRQFVGMTTTDGIYFDGCLRVSGDCSGPRSAEAVLQHPDVEVAVLETARGGILRSGLGWDKCQVAVVTNISNDHLGLDGIDSPERLAEVKRVPVESVAKGGCAVLNAEDPLVAAMADATTEAVIYFGRDPRGLVMSRHLATGGRAVFLRGNMVTLAEGARETPLLDANDIPAGMGGKISFQIVNAMTAAAACWGAGCPLDAIQLGLRTFQPDVDTAPGRFNLFTVGQATVILDYGHNPKALLAIRDAVQALAPRRSIGVVAAPGDRRDADIGELARIAAATFDRIIVREDTDLRGREPGEVAELICANISAARPDLPVTIIRDEAASIRAAIEEAQPGDLVVAFIDAVQASIALVRAAAAEAASGASSLACSLGPAPGPRPAEPLPSALRPRSGLTPPPPTLTAAPVVARPGDGEDRL
ncbi:MAG: cyanophycin synthetase [Chloroflexota bacterium]|nr:cyanophycin synthetase [Chloroflexota bacterium]